MINKTMVYKKKSNGLLNLRLENVTNLLKQQNTETFLHGMRVGEILLRFGIYLGLSKEENEKLHLLGYVHDIGKICIPESILNKTNLLTDEEWIVLKRHTFYGYNLLLLLIDQIEILNAVRYHHENLNGTGYEGLSGNQINFYSRLLRIVDSFDCMTNNRCYKKKNSIEFSLNELKRLSGSIYDQDLVIEFTDFYLKSYNYL